MGLAKARLRDPCWKSLITWGHSSDEFTIESWERRENIKHCLESIMPGRPNSAKSSFWKGRKCHMSTWMQSFSQLGRTLSNFQWVPSAHYNPKHMSSVCRHGCWKLWAEEMSMHVSVHGKCTKKFATINCKETSYKKPSHLDAFCIAELMPGLIHPKTQPQNVTQWTLLYME